MRERLAVPVLVFALLGGCAKSQPLPGAEPAPADPADFQPASLVVENQDFKDYQIYIESDLGVRTRLGSIAGNRIAEFRIPDHYARRGAPVRFLAVPIASPDKPTTQMLTLLPGEQITIRITP